MAGLQAERLGGREVTAVCGTHHHLRRLEIESLARRQIDLRLRLIALGDLGTEDRVPGEVVASRDVWTRTVGVLEVDRWRLRWRS
jgi:hypothetical protein